MYASAETLPNIGHEMDIGMDGDVPVDLMYSPPYSGNMNMVVLESAMSVCTTSFD
jgi:hypothetical protein